MAGALESTNMGLIFNTARGRGKRTGGKHEPFLTSRSYEFFEVYEQIEKKKKKKVEVERGGQVGHASHG